MRKALIVLVFSFLVSSVSGQLERLPDTVTFTTEAVMIDFENQKAGAEARTVLESWGIEFLASGTTVPRVSLAGRQTGFNFIPPEQTRVILNSGTDGEDPADSSLIINFRFPVQRVGFLFGNFDDTMRATLRAFDVAGNLLGTIEQAGLDNSAPPGEVFLGVGGDPASAIAKITLDYGDSNRAEQIDNLILQYVSRPTFQAYLAQIGDGIIPPGVLPQGSGALRTTILVTNVSNSTAQGDLRLLESSGAPLGLNLDGTVVEMLDLTIPPSTTLSFTSRGDRDPPSSGYAVIQSNVPVEATAIFQILDDDGNVFTEGGVGSTSGQVSQVGAVQRFVQLGVNSGIAVVNTSDAASDATAFLLTSSGEVIQVEEGQLDLLGGQHRAVFLDELFEDLPEGDVAGSLLVASDQPLAIVVLRTIFGLVSSSLPVGSTQR